MGIFSGSGVGKSILMSMIARFTSSEVNVIGLVGERGREVREFIQDYLEMKVFEERCDSCNLRVTTYAQAGRIYDPSSGRSF